MTLRSSPGPDASTEDGTNRSPRDLVGDVLIAAHLATVPIFVGWPAPGIAVAIAVVVVLVVLSKGFTIRESVAVAYAAPLAVSAPWPIHCFCAGLVLWLGAGRPRPSRSDRPAQRPVVLMAGVAALAVLGAVCGLIAIAIDRARVVDAGLVIPFAQPTPANLVLAIGVLALVNSVGEEILWRGALPRLAPLRTRRQLVLQISSFGVGHWYGIPAGVPGVLTSGVFSAVVFTIRQRFGFAAAVFVRFVTDVAIFCLVAEHAVWGQVGFTTGP